MALDVLASPLGIFRMRLTHCILVLLFGVASFALSSHAQAEELYRAEVRERHFGGKPLILEFEEQSRDERTSTARVTFKSGASMPSVLFVVKCFVEIGKKRNAAYLVILKEWKSENGDWMYRVGFSEDREINPSVYFGVPVASATQGQPQFLSIADLDRVLNPQK
jgi:hypothetical protein